MGLFLYEFLKFKTTGEKEWKKNSPTGQNKEPWTDLFTFLINISSAAWGSDQLIGFI